jgi:hypothetical protein
MTKRKRLPRKLKKKMKKAKKSVKNFPPPMPQMSASRNIETIPMVSLSETPVVSLSSAKNEFRYAGILIANEQRKDDKGTLGGVLVSDKGVHYGVTCFHVVKQNNQNFSTFLPEESVTVVSEKGDKIGIFNAETAFINTKLDIALIELNDIFGNEKIGSPSKFVEIPDLQLGTEVYFLNDRIKKKANGVIRKVNQKGNWRLGKYENTIFVSTVLDDENCERISDEGDSGSWLLRVSDNALVGVVFANSFTSTFVMPITEVIDAFKKKNIILSLNKKL